MTQHHDLDMTQHHDLDMTQHHDLDMTQHQDLDILGGVGPGEQGQPALDPGEHQITES
jgi:hypothetical protein